MFTSLSLREGGRERGREGEREGRREVKEERSQKFKSDSKMSKYCVVP